MARKIETKKLEKSQKVFERVLNNHGLLYILKTIMTKLISYYQNNFLAS